MSFFKRVTSARAEQRVKFNVMKFSEKRMHHGAAFNESSIRLGVKQDLCPRERSAGAGGRDNGRMMI